MSASLSYWSVACSGTNRRLFDLNRQRQCLPTKRIQAKADKLNSRLTVKLGLIDVKAPMVAALFANEHIDLALAGPRAEISDLADFLFGKFARYRR